MCCILLRVPIGAPSLLIILEGVLLLRVCRVPRWKFIGPWLCQDQVASLILILVLLVSLLSLACSMRGNRLGPGFLVCLMVRAVVRVLFFLRAGLIIFFVFFEAGLMPLIVLILGWGYQPERLQACLCLILYTVAGSLPIFAIICWSFTKCGSDVIILISSEHFDLSSLIWVILLTGFLVKMPVFGVHG